MTAHNTRHPFWQHTRNFIVAFYQTQRNAVFVLVALAIAFYILTGPDQAEDMINAVIYTGVFSQLFQYILLSTFVWSWVVYGSTRIILHISPVGLTINSACIWLLRWLPKLGGTLPPLLLAYAFWQPAQWQPYILLLEAVGTLLLFLFVERRTRIFALPKKWAFSDAYTSLRHDIRELWRHPLGRVVTTAGIVLTVALLLLFSLPVRWEIAQQLRPTAIVIFGIAYLHSGVVYCFISMTTATVLSCWWSLFI